MSFLLTNSDVVVVGIFLEPHDVAIYFAAAKTMALVHFINFSVKAASGPRFSSIIAEGDHAQLATAAIDAARWTFWLRRSGSVLSCLRPVICCCRSSAAPLRQVIW